MLDPMVILCFVFRGTSILFATVAEPTYSPTKSIAGREPQSFLLRLSTDWMGPIHSVQANLLYSKLTDLNVNHL